MGFVGSLGHISDTETGLIYMRARCYDPSLERFTSQDIAKSGGNWFVYCTNNPVNLSDKDEKAPWPVGAGELWLPGSVLATASCAVAMWTGPANKVGTSIATSLATPAVPAFSYASIGLLSPDMNLVMTNLKAYSAIIAIMVNGAKL